MAQMFVMCPFCSKIFDAFIEPYMNVSVDGHIRRAHLHCIPVRAEALTPDTVPQKKPNGDANAHAE